MDITLDLVLQQAVTGLALGAVYVLVAVGLSLIFGLLTVVNFAHGAFFMVGAYAGIATHEYTGSFLAAGVAAVVVSALIGAFSERVLVRPLYGRGIDYPLLLTFGISYVLVDAARILFGRQGLSIDLPEALQGGIDLGFGYFPLYRMLLVAGTLVLLALLWLGIERTRWGLIIRAGARDPLILRVLGVDVSRVWLAIFAFGAGLAGLAGILAAPLRGATPEMGDGVLVSAFVVTVVGGMGSLAGAVVAGFGLGVAVSLTTLFAPAFSDLAMFVFMAIVLLVRPNGLFGRAGLLS
ncbi:branched-chain amino acid ABC transporter permease [Rhodoplanes serenus]|jgi:branched-chain amino acid transport system permease protein|uniref:Branched-chain amino acid ABC transporter permease n=1 Tax=Rhodoplanes serenus TaxID=200615 RepID=A0A327KM77_9BRAD|nr:branched-chain amino acid ABC transporter permease [Rhodoplanes serenus]MTW18727.1 branched-chain amino acid ABC transporter permease [Rhodoplanes serenus]RAI36458.1 branched-chain amino acid ABC transporter permease [Rhodoplanes serenus]